MLQKDTKQFQSEGCQARRQQIQFVRCSINAHTNLEGPIANLQVLMLPSIGLLSYPDVKGKINI
jgi:hypothetical protein